MQLKGKIALAATGIGLLLGLAYTGYRQEQRIRDRAVDMAGVVVDEYFYQGIAGQVYGAYAMYLNDGKETMRIVFTYPRCKESPVELDREIDIKDTVEVKASQDSGQWWGLEAKKVREQ